MGRGTCHFSGRGRAPGWGAPEEGVSTLRRSPTPRPRALSPPPRRWGWSRSRPQTRRHPADGGRWRHHGRGRWACSGGQSTEASGLVGGPVGPAPPPGVTDPVGPTVLPPPCRTLRTRWTWGLGYTADRPPRSHPVRRQQRRGEGGGAQRCNHREQQRELHQPGGRRVGGWGRASAGAGGRGKVCQALSLVPPVCRGSACLQWPSTCVCVCAHICACMRACAQVCARVCVCVCMHVWACAHLCVHAGLCARRHVCESVRERVCVCARKVG